MALPENQEAPSYLLDSHALERCFAEGSPEEHELIAKQTSCTALVTSDAKSDFIDAYPDDRAAVSAACAVAALRTEDKKLAGLFSDRLQNHPNIEDPDVQDKLLLIAVARRLEATLVGAESAASQDSLDHLAGLLDAPYVSAEQFLSTL